jgi:hypothetical protein
MPLLMMIDGTLSNLRTYEEIDYNCLINSIPNARKNMEWKYLTIPVVDLTKGRIAKVPIFSFFIPYVAPFVEQLWKGRLIEL